MSEMFILDPPLLTADLPGIGGKIKVQPEDFEVEEIPAYEPTGSGDFLYLWIEKRDMGAEYFSRQIARRLNLHPGDIGTAGLKDRRAVTRQWVSVPAAAEANLPLVDGDGIRVLQVSRHTNKLRAGHLHGNRFRVVVRDARACEPSALVERLRQHGLPNYYGAQRFGREGETLRLGMDLVRGVTSERKVRNPFLKKLALSAAQSAVFNVYLGQRLTDGLLRRVLPGDVMAKYPFGGMFTAEDVVREQARFDAHEIVSAGPIVGRKTFPAKDEAAAREAKALEALQLTPAQFAGFGKLMQGTRRHNLIYLDDLTCETVPPSPPWGEGPGVRGGPSTQIVTPSEDPRETGPETTGDPTFDVRFSFTLPAGSYATVLLRELMKQEIQNPFDDEGGLCE